MFGYLDTKRAQFILRCPVLGLWAVVKADEDIEKTMDAMIEKYLNACEKGLEPDRWQTGAS